MHQSISSKSPGFTLIEVLITLVIIAIVAAISAPAILSMAPNMALKSATQELYSSLQEAKVLAIKTNMEVSVRVNAAGYTIDEPFIDANGDGVYTPGPPAETYADLDGDGLYSAVKNIVFTNEYEYGIALGTGKATADWNNLPCATVGNLCNTPAATITFNSRGTSNADSAFIQNNKNDLCYAISVSVAGSVKTRKYGGADPFNVINWTE